jgi:hypothetical protein
LGPAPAGVPDKKPEGKPRGGMPPARGAGRLMVDEKIETTAVKKDVYFYYARAVGISVAVGTLILQIVNQGFSLGTNFWLAKWYLTSLFICPSVYLLICLLANLSTC